MSRCPSAAGVESLRAANAVGQLLWEVSRQPLASIEDAAQQRAATDEAQKGGV